jgi:hypothetical protein
MSEKKHGFDLSNVKDLEEIHLLLMEDGVKYCCEKRKNFLFAAFRNYALKLHKNLYHT